MSDDTGENKPLKLKLSRDLALPKEEKEVPSPAPAKPAAQAAPKLKITPLKSAPQDETNPEVKAPVEDFPAAKKAVSPPPPAPSAPPPPAAAAVQPTLPPKLPPVQNDMPPPSPAPRKAPAASGTSGGEKGSQSSPLASLLLILAILLVIGGACGGIWYVLMGSQPESGDATTTNTPPVVASTTPSGPIAKAKAVVEQVAQAEADAGALLNPAEPVAVKPVQAETSAPKADSKVDTNEYRDQVSAYLSDAQVGAVRTGNQARVMLDDISYVIGDTVEPSTGLVFVGTKDGRLVFKDRNGVYYLKSF
ncbi:hypothetical protein [Coraliomargarita parva]|uniref:hypothetical protein n=1 Tax=Coraliomargarita parva TaxID=3014050 RepID=UPI0022B2B859|nr:hypothetical protein [Coraliomargarita parva]